MDDETKRLVKGLFYAVAKWAVSELDPKKEKITEQPKKKSTKISMNKVISELKKDLFKNGITAKNMKTKKKLMSERVTSYFSKNKINKKYKTKILTKLVESIIRG